MGIEIEETTKYLKLTNIFVEFTISLWKIDKIYVFPFLVQQFLDRSIKLQLPYNIVCYIHKLDENVFDTLELNHSKGIIKCQFITSNQSIQCLSTSNAKRQCKRSYLPMIRTEASKSSPFL